MGSIIPPQLTPTQIAADPALTSTFAPLASVFEFTASVPSVSNVAWADSTVTANSGDAYGVRRTTSAFTVGGEVVFELPVHLRGGTWTLALFHRQLSSNGIYTISSSVDGSSWTTHGTIDGYAAGVNLRSELAGITVPAQTAFVRLQILAKNGSSSAFGGCIFGLSGRRTGI